MNRINGTANRIGGEDLQRMIEPLASYICATDQPQAALLSALALLYREVEGTNRAALSHFQAYLQN
jgi:hypothetical protein